MCVPSAVRCRAVRALQWEWINYRLINRAPRKRELSMTTTTITHKKHPWSSRDASDIAKWTHSSFVIVNVVYIELSIALQFRTTFCQFWWIFIVYQVDRTTKRQRREARDLWWYGEYFDNGWQCGYHDCFIILHTHTNGKTQSRARWSFADHLTAV